MSGGDPFGGVPFFGDLAKMLGQQGPISWDAARQIAHTIATEGQPEANVDPLGRIAVEQLARVAELQVAHATGLDPAVGGLSIVGVTRTQFVAQTLDDHRPLFEALARTLGSGASAADSDTDLEPAGDDGDPAGAFMSQLMGLIQPMTLGMAAGSMVGHLATRSFGQYDLPLPRQDRSEIMVLLPAIDSFAEEWSLGVDDVRLWVCLHHVAHHAVFGIPHVRDAVRSLVEEYVAGFRPDPQSFERALGAVDPSDPSGLEAMQRVFSDPEVLLGASTSPAQEAVRPRLDALIAAIVGWVDHVMDRVGGPLVGSYAQVTEAVRRRRVESSAADRFVEQLFGLNLTQARCDLGAGFVDGIVERAGEEGLVRLWARPEHLPTPAELEAPGLWLARIDLDTEPDSDTDLS